MPETKQPAPQAPSSVEGAPTEPRRKPNLIGLEQAEIQVAPGGESKPAPGSDWGTDEDLER